MKKLELKRPGVGFYILAASAVFAIAAFVMYSLTYDALGYASDKTVIAMMVMAFWCIGWLMLTAVYSGNAPKVTDVFYWGAVFTLTVATFKFLTPCLSPIGIYFTVGTMGDVEANAIGVPRCIAGIVLYVISILCAVTSAFFPPASRSEQKVASNSEPVNAPAKERDDEQAPDVGEAEEQTEYEGTEHAAEEVDDVE